MERSNYSPPEKVATLRGHFLEGVPMSELCEELRRHSTQFYRWQKQFFEEGTAAFDKDQSQLSIFPGGISNAASPANCYPTTESYPWQPKGSNAIYNTKGLTYSS